MSAVRDAEAMLVTASGQRHHGHPVDDCIALVRCGISRYPGTGANDGALERITASSARSSVYLVPARWSSNAAAELTASG